MLRDSMGSCMRKQTTVPMSAHKSWRLRGQRDVILIADTMTHLDGRH